MNNQKCDLWTLGKIVLVSCSHYHNSSHYKETMHSRLMPCLNISDLVSSLLLLQYQISYMNDADALLSG